MTVQNPFPNPGNLQFNGSILSIAAVKKNKKEKKIFIKTEGKNKYIKKYKSLITNNLTKKADEFIIVSHKFLRN